MPKAFPPARGWPLISITNNVWANTGTNYGAGLGTVGVLDWLNCFGTECDQFYNLSVDPRFVDADGLDNDAETVGDQ